MSTYGAAFAIANNETPSPGVLLGPDEFAITTWTVGSVGAGQSAPCIQHVIFGPNSTIHASPWTTPHGEVLTFLDGVKFRNS